MRLVTIPFSHFCEKARWALDHAGLAYVEDGHAPMLSWAAAVTASGQRQVPVLVPDEGRAVAGSTAILRWADAHRQADASELWPEVHDRALATYVAELDRTLGPAARRVAYFTLLKEAELMRELLTASAGPWEKRVVGAGWRTLAAGIRRGLRVDAAGSARSREVLTRVFDEADRRLAEGPYLVGDAFGAADLTFASLATPVLFPPELEAWMLPLSRLPADAREDVERLRARPAGRHALRVYAEKRPRSCPASR